MAASSCAWPGSRRSPHSGHRPGAVGLAQRRDRLDEVDRLDHQRPQVQLVVVGEARASRGRRPPRGRRRSRSPRSIDGRISSSIRALTGVTSGRRQRAHSPAIAVVRRASATRPRFVRDSRSVPGDGLGEDERRRPGPRRRASIAYSRTVPGASAMRPESAKTSGSPTGSTGCGRPGPDRLIAGRRPRPPPRRSAMRRHLERRDAVVAVVDADRRGVGRAAVVEHRDPPLDAAQRPRDLGLEAREHARTRSRRRRAGRRRRPPRRSPMIRRLSSAAASVRPRSLIRKAACSWARATIRSASSWAFSMIRSPSWLIRLAARTSSGTATRSSSMRLRAASRSMIALWVSGNGLPLAISDSSRSTRKMMSSGRPPVRAVPAGRCPRLWHAGRLPTLPWRQRVAERRARPAAGTIDDTSPPNRAISLTRLELM